MKPSCDYSLMGGASCSFLAVAVARRKEVFQLPSEAGIKQRRWISSLPQFSPATFLVRSDSLIHPLLSPLFHSASRETQWSCI